MTINSSVIVGLRLDKIRIARCSVWGGETGIACPDVSACDTNFTRRAERVRGSSSVSAFRALAAQCDSDPAHASSAGACRGSRTLFKACMVGCTLALDENDEFLYGLTPSR